MIAFRLFPILALLTLFTGFARSEAFLRADTASDSGGKRLQTRVTHYTHPSGVRLTLLATIHVADAAYFERMATRLRETDSVIYESVVRRQSQLISRLDFAATLGLVTQMSVLDCRGDRFVPGDLDETRFEAKRVRSIPLSPPPASKVELAEGLLRFESDPTTRQMTHDALAILPRNTEALAALRHRLARGDQKIVLLYGAAHADDLHTRLQSQFGFKAESSEWLDAFEY